MAGVISVIFTFWTDVISAFNSVLSENTDFDLSLIIFSSVRVARKAVNTIIRITIYPPVFIIHLGAIMNTGG